MKKLSYREVLRSRGGLVLPILSKSKAGSRWTLAQLFLVGAITFRARLSFKESAYKLRYKAGGISLAAFR